MPRVSGVSDDADPVNMAFHERILKGKVPF